MVRWFVACAERCPVLRQWDGMVGTTLEGSLVRAFPLLRVEACGERLGRLGCSSVGKRGLLRTVLLFLPSAIPLFDRPGRAVMRRGLVCWQQGSFSACDTQGSVTVLPLGETIVRRSSS